MRGQVSARHTPLCPAGHLPLKGGDRQILSWCQSFDVGQRAKRWRQPISPLEGEMAGRPEGGERRDTNCGTAQP